jgi:heptosyltransferase-3
MRLLFIKPKQIGDTIILTPTLVAVRQAYPDAEIWVAVRHGCESILAGCPEIDRILTVASVEKSDRSASDLLRQAAILARLATTRFDYVFELGDGDRGRLFARATRTGRRYSVLPDMPMRGAQARAFTKVSTYPWRWTHRVEKDYWSVAEFLPLPAEIPPLRFDRARTQEWAPAANLSDFVVMQTGTRQGFNRWTTEGWRTVAAHLLTRIENVVVTCGTSPRDLAEAAALHEEFGDRLLFTRGEASWAAVAGLLYRARFYVGPATAAMHLAAACHCPAVAMFGQTIEENWYPWQSPYRAVTATDLSQISDPDARARHILSHSMECTPAQSVIAACDELLAAPR